MAKDDIEHLDWAFRREAFTRVGGRPSHYNFYPFATELRNWMRRKPDRLGVFSPVEHDLTNPYTFDSSVLIGVFQGVVNAGAAFGQGASDLAPDEAEFKRIRLYGEAILYAARICEALIKQLLFCTTIPEREYRGCALGSLLSKDCSSCRQRKPREEWHKISPLGSLAHRYRLCRTYDSCLDKHLKLFNRRRDTESAHSGIAKFKPQPVEAARRNFRKEFNAVGEEMIHMLYHIGELETRMLNELSRPFNRVRLWARAE